MRVMHVVVVVVVEGAEREGMSVVCSLASHCDCPCLNQPQALLLQHSRLDMWRTGGRSLQPAGTRYTAPEPAPPCSAMLPHAADPGNAVSSGVCFWCEGRAGRQPQRRSHLPPPCADGAASGGGGGRSARAGRGRGTWRPRHQFSGCHGGERRRSAGSAGALHHQHRGGCGAGCAGAHCRGALEDSRSKGCAVQGRWTRGPALLPQLLRRCQPCGCRRLK